MKKMNLAFFITLAVIGLCCISSRAMAPTESTNAEYLKNHGYSPEMIRLVNMQKERIEQTNISEKKGIGNSKVGKTIKQWFRVSDVTMGPDFGSNSIKF